MNFTPTIMRPSQFFTLSPPASQAKAQPCASAIHVPLINYFPQSP